MDVTFVICPNFLGVLGLSILLVFTRFNFYLDKKQINLFRAAAVVNIIIIVFEVADYLLGKTPFPSAYLFRRVTSATGFALTPIFPLLLAQISSKKELPKWVYIPAAVNVIFSYGSMASGHLFFIDSYNSYFRGPLFICMMLISAFYLTLLIYISFKNLQSVRASESGFLICIVAVCVIANLLEIALSFHFLIWNCCAILLTSYYLYLHIQYFKYDPLTRSFNRSMFSAALGSMAHKENVGVISFDLDNLKIVNDREGHERGDEYIIASAAQIQRSFSDVGRLYRVGGDEFVVLMENTTEAIMQSRIKLFHDSCLQNGVSISCGYSFHTSAADLTELLRRADKAMYENKRERQLDR